METRFRAFLCLLRLVLLVGWLSASGQSTQSRTDPTHWLNVGQSYVKLPIAEPGIYRITTSELRRAGLPVDQINPQSVQLFHRGIEQAIFVAGEADGRFDADDFLEFYGRGNDGVADSALYRPANAQPHSFYSLFSDTTVYFLTWRNGTVGKRMATYADTSGVGLSPEPFHWADEIRLFTDNYPGWAAGIPPKIEYSHYEAGEGYTGVIQLKDKPFSQSFELTNAVRTGTPPQLDILLVGREYINHRVDCRIGPSLTDQRLLDSVRFSTYDNAGIQQAIQWTDVGADGRLRVTTVSKGEQTSSDNYSVSYVRLRYPQGFDIAGQADKVFELTANPVGRSLLQFRTLPDRARFWDITNPAAPIRLERPATADSARLIIRHTQTARALFYTRQPKRVPAIRPVRFTDLSSQRPTFLLISHENLVHPTPDPATGRLVNAVQAYAAYRASAAGGRHDTLTVTLQQLIDQYNYGERSPLAIRHFLDALAQRPNNRLANVLLIGRARSIPGIRRYPDQDVLDLVMTAGFPGSDLVFTADSSGVPAVPIGRINAGTPQEVLAYLAKVIDYERQDDDAGWRKNLLHLSGGQSPTERDLFSQLVDAYGQLVTEGAPGARVTRLSKTTDAPIEPVTLASRINEGVGVVTFFGHSGLDITDLDIGFCSSDALGYRNKGRYPLLFINGCAIGNFFFGKPTLATDWVLTPDRGAIAAIAHCHLGVPDVMHRYTRTFYAILADSSYVNQSIGQLQRETIRRVLTHSTDGRELANCQQMVLQGDPAIRLFPFRTPDYVLTPASLTVLDGRSQKNNEQLLSTLSDSVLIRAVVQNAGLCRKSPLPVRLRRWVNGREAGVFSTVLPGSVAFQDTLTLRIPNERNSPGEHTFELTINPPDVPLAQEERKQSNNQARIALMVSNPTDARIASLTVAPNPFYDQTLFSVLLMHKTPSTTLSLTILTAYGLPVRHGRMSPQTVCLNEWAWDGRDDSGNQLPAGLYIYRLSLEDGQSGAVDDNVTGRLLLIR